MRAGALSEVAQPQRETVGSRGDTILYENNVLTAAFVPRAAADVSRNRCI